MKNWIASLLDCGCLVRIDEFPDGDMTTLLEPCDQHKEGLVE